MTNSGRLASRVRHVFFDEQVHPIREYLVHDDRVIVVVVRAVRSRELLCLWRERSGGLEDVVRLEFGPECVADFLVLVLRDLRDADGMCDLVVPELVQPEEHVPDITPHHGRCLTMNENVRIEQDAHDFISRTF